MTKGGNAMQIWNRVFLMEPGRQAEATGALVAVHEAINAVSDYGYNLWETVVGTQGEYCLLYTSPSPRDRSLSRMPSSA